MKFNGQEIIPLLLSLAKCFYNMLSELDFFPHNNPVK